MIKNNSGSNEYIGQTKRRFMTDRIIPFCVPRYVEHTAAKNMTIQRSVEIVERYTDVPIVISDVMIIR